MDSKQLVEFLNKNGFFNQKGKTIPRFFTIAPYKSFFTEQAGNRSSTSWKTAEYIVVDDCKVENRDFLLANWPNVTGKYTDQCLLIYDEETEKYDVYDHKGDYLGDDSSLEEIIYKTKYPKWKWSRRSTFDPIATNKIFYGVPGCGKSHHIQHKILVKEKYDEENIIRTTFYQDYSNTDFVGQILPKISKATDGRKDVVEYIFNPGPFTLALIQAISNPTKKVALVVEEINRGNAPAIFGDIFQLLDRDDEGVSEYGIKNVSILDYLNDYEFGVEKKHYHFDEIKIPGNMDIFATMNTSDQNVYTLDTAFTRRWGKELISNEFSDTDTIKDLKVPGMADVSWELFITTINKTISDKIDELQVNEDKQVGKFFVKKTNLIDSTNPEDKDAEEEKAEIFAYKVLEYLWNDVSKLDHTVIFNPEYKTFAKLIEGYKKHSVKIFSNEIVGALEKINPKISIRGTLK